MDKNGKIFGKISIIDLLAVLVLIVVLAGTVYRFSAPATRVDKNSSVINYTLKINGVRDFTLPYYVEGLKCYDKKTSQYIGKIKSVRSEQFFQEIFTKEGKIEMIDQPGIMIIYLDIEAQGTETDKAYFAEGTYEIKVGSKVNLNFKYVDVTAVVHSIKK